MPLYQKAPFSHTFQLDCFDVQKEATYIYFIIFEKMDGLNNPFYQPYYYFLMTPSLLQPVEISQVSNRLPTPRQTNAENKRKTTDLPRRVAISKEDLLREGYEQTKKAWTQEQDALLLRLCADENARFEEVAALIPGRNAKMCYSRWRRLGNQSKQSWSMVENDRLRSLVKEKGQNWRTFVQYFPNRNYRQLKDHYNNYLRPDLTSKEWTLEQDLRLVQLVNQLGKDWKALQQKLPHRSRNQIKNRVFGRLLRIHLRKMAENRP